MFKNRILVVVAAALIAAVGWFGGGSSLATAVPIPEELNAYVAGLVFAAVTAGFAFVFQYIGLDLRGFAVQISGVLSAFVLGELQKWVNLIPAQYESFVSIAFNVLVVILSGVGTLYVANRLAGRGKLEGLL